MKNLITGGSGFIGQHLAKALIAKGEQVRIYDLTPPQDLQSATSVEFIQASITDKTILTANCADVDCVFHMAANAHLWAKNKSDYETINHIGTQNVVAAAKQADVKKFVHISSLTVLASRRFGRSLQSVDEQLELSEEELLGPYPRSKRKAELAVLEAAEQGMDAVIGLPTMPIGPGDRGLTGPTKMILDYINGKTPAILNTRMNLIDVRELAKALVALREKGVRGERYILGGQNVWLQELLVTLQTVSGVKMPSIQVPYGLALTVGIIDEWVADYITHKPPTAPLTGVRIAGRWLDYSIAKAQAELGLVVSPLDLTLKDQIDWFRTEGLLTRQTAKSSS